MRPEKPEQKNSLAEPLNRKLPSVRGNKALRVLSGQNVRSQFLLLPRAVVVGSLKQEGRAGIPVPHLHRIDAMPMGHLAGLQEK